MNDHQADDDFSTDDAEVDAAVERLAELDAKPVDEHAPVYNDVHRLLGAVLDGPSDDPPTGQ